MFECWGLPIVEPKLFFINHLLLSAVPSEGGSELVVGSLDSWYALVVDMLAVFMDPQPIIGKLLAHEGLRC